MLTGRPEPTLIFVQDNDQLVQMAVRAVQSFAVPRTRVRVPTRGGQGIWAGLGDIAVKRNIPGFAISSEMSAYWSTAPGLESFDSELCYRQVGALVSMTADLIAAPLAEIAVPVTERGASP